MLLVGPSRDGGGGAVSVVVGGGGRDVFMQLMGGGLPSCDVVLLGGGGVGSDTLSAVGVVGGRDVSMQLFSGVVGEGGRGVSMQLFEGGAAVLGGGGGGLFLPPTGVSLWLSEGGLLILLVVGVGGGSWESSFLLIKRSGMLRCWGGFNFIFGWEFLAGALPLHRLLNFCCSRCTFPGFLGRGDCVVIPLPLFCVGLKFSKPHRPLFCLDFSQVGLFSALWAGVQVASNCGGCGDTCLLSCGV